MTDPHPLEPHDERRPAAPSEALQQPPPSGVREPAAAIGMQSASPVHPGRPWRIPTDPPPV